MLGVARDASHDTIHRAYRVLARRLHPDVAAAHGTDANDMAAVNEAWEVLGDERSRAEYDHSLGIEKREVTFFLEPEPPRGFGPIGRFAYAKSLGWLRSDPERDNKWQMALRALSQDLSALDELDDRDLWRLDLRRSAAGDEQVRALTRFKSLEELQLGNTAATEACVPALLELPHLRVLDVDCCPITDDGLRQLASIKTLEELLLFDTRVTDAGMESLAFHPELAVLDLRDTEVTRDGVVPLLTMPELHELRLPRRAHHGLHQMRKIRPDVRVI